MKYAKPLIGTAVLLGLMLAASAWAWGRLGDAPMPVHFGLDGRLNGYAPKAWGLLAMPLIGLAMAGLYTIMPPLMPERSRLERSWGAYEAVWLATLTLMLALHLAIIAFALGVAMDMGRIVAIGIGGLSVVIGNVLGKVRYNYVFGFRTPWTLGSERVWDRTHRFTGWVMTLAGLLLVAVGLFAPAKGDALLPIGILLATLAPVAAGTVYSMIESRRVERA